MLSAASGKDDAVTAEDKARELLGRMGIDGPFSSGELVELANLIADHDHKSRVLNALRRPGHQPIVAITKTKKRPRVPSRIS